MSPLSGTHIFPILSLLTDLLKEAFYFTLDVLGHYFSFPNLLPGCSGNFCVFLPGYLSLLPPSLSYLLVFKVVQEIFSQFSVCRDALLLSLEERTLDYHPAFLGPLPSRAPSHGSLLKRSLKTTRSALLKSRIMSFYPLCCPTDLKCHCLIVTAFQAIL